MDDYYFTTYISLIFSGALHLRIPSLPLLKTQHTDDEERGGREEEQREGYRRRTVNDPSSDATVVATGIRGEGSNNAVLPLQYLPSRIYS